MRIPGVCKNNRSTVVLCHTNEHRAAGGGMGLKPHDLLAFYACSACHDAADGRAMVVCDNTGRPYTRDEIRVMEYQAVIRTLKILLDAELLFVAEIETLKNKPKVDILARKKV
jgi:hypothetical protein